LIFWKCFEIWPFSNYLYLKIPLEHLQQCSICDVAKNIFHIQVELSYVLFCNPTYKTKTRDIKKARRLLIANHLDQSLWWANRNHWAAVRSYFITLFLGGEQCCCAFYQARQHAQLCEAKSISLHQTIIPWIFFTQFYYADHILSIVWDALSCIFYKIK
jgi:hypothetical protein